jgi:hypothetical protein
MAISAGLYGSENWVLTEKDKNRIQAAEEEMDKSNLRGSNGQKSNA